MNNNSKYKEAAMKYSDDRYYNLFISIDATRNAVFKARKKELKKYQMSLRQAAVLYFSNEKSGKVTPTQIAKWLVLEPHSSSEQVGRMEKDGFVKRIKYENSSRYYKIKLTKKGLDALHNSSKRESIHRVMSCLSDEEQEQLYSILLKLKVKAFEEFS